MKKFLILIIILLCTTPILAEVNQVGSGVLRGSMRNIVIFDSFQEVISGVKPGDFISFQLPEKDYYSKSTFEKTGFYVQRYSEDKAVYDWGLERFLDMQVGETIEFELENHTIAIELLNKTYRDGTFRVELMSDNLIVEGTDNSEEEIVISEPTVKEETKEDVKPAITKEPEVIEENTNKDVKETTIMVKEEKKGFFKFFSWLFKLF